MHHAVKGASAPQQKAPVQQKVSAAEEADFWQDAR